MNLCGFKLINQEIEMYYLVSVDHNSTAAHLTRSDGGFKKCCISSVVDGADGGMLWNGSEEDGGC